MNEEIILDMDEKSNQIKTNPELQDLLKNLLSGCRINFLLGAGFSAKILKPLEYQEILFETLRLYASADEIHTKKATIIKAYLYWNFFTTSILPIQNVGYEMGQEYLKFGRIISTILNERSNPVLDRQCNVFTTNYDPILELIFDNLQIIYNDGFEGRIIPKFSTDNFTKSYYRQAIFSNKKSEIPSINILKLHGSLTWQYYQAKDEIWYQDYINTINSFHNKYGNLFDNSLEKLIIDQLNAKDYDSAYKQVQSLIESDILDSALTNSTSYKNMLGAYSNQFLIVNPTKEKFSSTLTNKNYYELLRIFSNELEKENVLLIVFGFSFKDEHILDITKRSMLNPSLKILLFCYTEDELNRMRTLFDNSKNDNITFIYVKNSKLELEHFSNILSTTFEK